MRHALRILVAAAVLLGGIASRVAAESASLTRGTAITDPDLLRKLDQTLTIARLLAPERNAEAPPTTDRMFSELPQLKEIPSAIDTEFERYIAQQKAAYPTETAGVGEGFDVQLFDRANLQSRETRFVLAGIVNRMDRAYVSEESCGEIRLIYRLARFDGTTATRLPMTLNLVMKARDARQMDGNGKPISCAEVARRWLDNGNWQELIGSRDDAMLDRIETNIQLSVAPKSALHDFRSDYLLKVFKYDAATRTFAESTLENQIDRDRIMADDALRRDFKAWLLAPENLRAFDRGTVLIPEEFLARAAVVPTPAGLDASALQPEFGMMQGEGKGQGKEEGKDSPVFTDNDVVGALKQAAARGELQNIRSVAGFQRRLNDVTCAGCHQTRGIGGFHFPGVDWLADKPSNSTIVPASPHFIGDQLRRRDILTAFAAGKQPDFSRGFASRPQTRGSRELAGTEYQDGWGAHCSLQEAGPGTRDASFTSWSCATGLTCQAAAASRHIGMCFIKTR